jgi:uncharacterized membrane protein
MKDSHSRSLIKGITWRTIGTMDTMLLAFLITGNFIFAIKIGLTEVVTKVVLYYLHERTWNIVPWGRTATGPSHFRSLIKGISWRALGTFDTIMLSYIIVGRLSDSLKIGGVELVTKITLYYLHERLWSNIKWGRIELHSTGNKTESLSSTVI